MVTFVQTGTVNRLQSAQNVARYHPTDLIGRRPLLLVYEHEVSAVAVPAEGAAVAVADATAVRIGNVVLPWKRESNFRAIKEGKDREKKSGCSAVALRRRK